MTDKKLLTEKQIAIYDMLDAKCTVTDEGVQGFLTWKQIRDVYNSIIEETKEIDFEKELRKYFGQVKDFTLCMNIAKKFYDKGYFDGHIHDGDKIVHVDRRQVNVSRFRRVAKPLEAHVSEGLEEEVKKLWREINTGHEYAILDSYNILYGICLDIANWQKEQFEKNRLKHCNSITNEQAELEQCFIDQQLDKYNRMPTFIDAIEYGMSLHKEQMMAKAFDFTKKHNTACVLASECLRNHGWFNRERDFNDLFRHLSCVDELFEGKFSGKTKVIVIKED